MTLVTEANRTLGLSGPMGATIALGSPLATNIAYWAATTVALLGRHSANDLVPAAHDYVDAFAGPYFQVMAEWFGLLRIAPRRKTRRTDCREAAIRPLPHFPESRSPDSSGRVISSHLCRIGRADAFRMVMQWM